MRDVFIVFVLNVGGGVIVLFIMNSKLFFLYYCLIVWVLDICVIGLVIVLENIVCVFGCFVVIIFCIEVMFIKVSFILKFCNVFIKL